MDPTFQNLCSDLRQLAGVTRLRLESPDEVLGTLNVLIDQLAQSGLLNDTALLGRVIGMKGDRQDSPLLQAALLVPGGMGIAVWNAAQFWQMRDNWPQSRCNMFIDFVPLEGCDAAEKELLLPQARRLLNLLCRSLRQLYECPDEAS